MDEIEIRPISHPLDACVTPPGSKSITNRALILAAMAKGHSELSGVLISDDTRYMLDALTRLGVVIELDEQKKQIAVTGGSPPIAAHGADLYVGGAGTAMRFIAGLVTLGRGRFRIDGNAQMRARPLADLVATLRMLGIPVTCEIAEGFPPIVIASPGPAFRGGVAAINASVSSQFVSALVMPAPLWADGLRLTLRHPVARPFIEMTLKLMKSWGGNASAIRDEIVVEGGASYVPMNFAVEADASSASYFAAAAALCGGKIVIRGIARDSMQGDARFLDLLERMGATVTHFADSVEVCCNSTMRGIDADLSDTPDMVPTLAAIAPFASSPTTIRNVAFIRHHESDRLTAVATELRRLGADVEELSDGLRIKPSALHPAAIETYDDHRIAMSFATIGLKIAGVRIRNPGCVAKTYPGFFEDLARLGN